MRRRTWHQWVADTLSTELMKPLITRPSPSVLTTIIGSTAAFTVATSGVAAPPSYQWQVLSGGVYVNLVDDSRIQGSQTSRLRIGSVSLADGTSYRCLVSGLNSGPPL